MRLQSFALLMTAALMGTTAFAAHQYNMNQSTSLNGSVTKVEWNNPDYVKIHINATGNNGKLQDWEIQTASANMLRSDGVSSGTLKDGDQITVQGYPASDGSPHMLATSLSLANGQTVALNNQAPAQTSQNTTANAADTNQQSLPQTATNIPLIGLIGLISLAAGSGLALRRRIN